MSRLLRNEGAGSVARLGSFVLRRGDAGFRPNAAAGAGPDGQAETGSDAGATAAEAFDLGYAAGRETVEAEFAAERDAIARLAEALSTLRPEPTNALALLLAETVDRLVREIIGSVEVDSTLLLERAKAAAALIGENVEPSKLRAHPEDAALLCDADLPVPVEADASLERGTIILETGHGWIEDGPAVRLERLRAELDRMAAPK